MRSVITWNQNMKFSAMAESGHEVRMDASVENSGENSGQRPKELLLDGLGGCSGMDVIAILKKMKAEPKSFRVEVTAEQTEDHPKIFKNIHIKYIFDKGVDSTKAEKAVSLSQEKYCGVSEILRRSADVTHEIIYE